MITHHGIPTPLLFIALDAIHRTPDAMEDGITDGEQFEEGTPGIDDLEVERDETLNDTLREIARVQIPGRIK